MRFFFTWVFGETGYRGNCWKSHAWLDEWVPLSWLQKKWPLWKCAAVSWNFFVARISCKWCNRSLGGVCCVQREVTVAVRLEVFSRGLTLSGYIVVRSLWGRGSSQVPRAALLWRVHLSGSGKFGSFGQGASCHVLAALLVVCNQNFTRKLVSNWRVSAIGFRNVNYHIISNQ